MTEEWRLVPSYPFLEASSLGRVRYRGPDRPVWKDGYVIPLQKNGQKAKYRAVSVPGDLVGQSSGQKTLLVHRLVCEAFHGAPPPGMTLVEHRDDDGTNNSESNLFWSTVVANANRPDALRKNRASNIGKVRKPVSEETRAKMSAARGRWRAEQCVTESRVPLRDL